MNALEQAAKAYSSSSLKNCADPISVEVPPGSVSRLQPGHHDRRRQGRGAAPAAPTPAPRRYSIGRLAQGPIPSLDYPGDDWFGPHSDADFAELWA